MAGGTSARATSLVAAIVVCVAGALSVLGALGMAVPTSAITISADTNTYWSAYLDGPTHDSYNASATSISPADIEDLQPVWRWFVPKGPDGGSTKLWASPTVYDGVVYVGAENGVFYAVSEATRQVLWSQFMGVDTPKGDCGGTNGPGMGITSTATVADDPSTGEPTVYVFGPDGNLYAMNASDGGIVWKSSVDSPSPVENDYYSWSSPTVANGSVYIGISSECDHPLVPAGVVSYDQSTGAQTAFWHSRGSGKSGASVWSSVGVLPNGDVIATTGNANNGNGAQQKYGESIVRLDGATLKLLDYWQVPTAEAITDSDFGGSPTQFTAEINGVPTLMLGACNKNGIYYAFQADDLKAGPVWQYELGAGECDAAAVWDGTNLIEGGGGDATIDGVSFEGSVQSINPATGEPIWETGLPGGVIGSPTEDGGGVVAASVFFSPTDQTGVYLLNAQTGAIIDEITLPHSALFGQAVWDNNDLLIGAAGSTGLTAYEITTPGPSLTVSPNTFAQAAKKQKLTVDGGDFSGQPTVFLSGTGFSVGSVQVLSPTELTVRVNVSSNAASGPYSVTVVEPGGPPYTTDSCSGCITVDSSDSS